MQSKRQTLYKTYMTDNRSVIRGRMIIDDHQRWGIFDGIHREMDANHHTKEKA